MISLSDTPLLPASQRPLSAVELLTISYEALSPAEQGQLIERLQQLRLQGAASELTEAERILGSLQRVAELAGVEPENLTVDHYRAAIRSEIENGGPGIAPLSQVNGVFGTWRQAKEALILSPDNTAAQIEARFACRRLGRVHSYSEEVMRETLEHCRDDLGHVPTLGEFKAWRRHMIELARAQGNPHHYLPGINAYRGRNSHWQDTLTHYLGTDYRAKADQS